MNEAINLSKSQRRLSAVVRDVDSIAKARAMEEAEKIRKAIEDEKAERAARKAALNAKWSSSASTSEKKG